MVRLLCCVRQQSYQTDAQIAQLVEQRTENPRVAGSIPALGIFLQLKCLYRRNKYLYQKEYQERSGKNNVCI